MTVDVTNSRKAEWDSLPYPVIHTIAKLDLEKFIYEVLTISVDHYWAAELSFPSELQIILKFMIRKSNIAKSLKHLERLTTDDQVPVRHTLALNRHWNYVMLDYSPSKLDVDFSVIMRVIWKNKNFYNYQLLKENRYNNTYLQKNLRFL